MVKHQIKCKICGKSVSSRGWPNHRLSHTSDEIKKAGIKFSDIYKE